MGRAVIVSHIGDSLYTIRLSYATRAMDDEIARIDADAAREAQRIAGLDSAVSDAAAALADSDVAVGDMIDAIRAGTLDPGSTEKIAPVMVARHLAVVRKKNADAARARAELEKVEREQRRAALAALRDRAQAPIHAWCVWWATHLQPGAEVCTAEVPGFFSSTPVSRVTVMGDQDPTGPGWEYVYDDRPINILPYAPSDYFGGLRWAALLPDAAVWLNVALEPGHLRWAPWYRYGTILETYSDRPTCRLLLDVEYARRLPVYLPDRLDIDGDAARILEECPLYYPCGVGLYQVGDEVLVEYQDQDREKPRVIGWRRKPPICDRISWGQIR